MSRSSKKGPFVDEKTQKKVLNLKAGDKTVIKTWARSCSITPEMVGFTRALGANDPDLPTQALAVKLEQGPAGMVLTNGVLAWTPTEAQGPSTNTVVVSVNDGVTGTTNTFTLV